MSDTEPQDVAVAEVLAAHEADVTSYDAGDLWGCRCGWELTASQRSHDYDGDKWADYRAHVAEALAPLIAERVREAVEGARDESAVAEVGLTEAEWTRLRHAAGNRGDLGPIAEEFERILGERERAAAVEALREAADRLPALTEGTDRAGTETWRPHDRDIYSLAIEEAQVRVAQAEALRTAARRFVEDMAEAWGGDSQWLTTGTRVAEVAACVLREMADEVDATTARCAHEWLDRPESDTRECLICGTEVAG